MLEFFVHLKWLYKKAFLIL